MSKTYIKDHTNTFVINNKEYEVTAPARFDSKTNELIPDIELDDAAIEIANSLYRKDMGIISPQEIKGYRKKIGLTQREFAKLFGWSPNTVALYETGAFPSAANNKILKMLFENDSALESLFNQGINDFSQEMKTKLNNYLSNKTEKTTVQNSEKSRYSALQLTNWYRVNNYYDSESDPNVENLTQMKVIKLLYFAFGRYAAQKHQKLFESPIIAMDYGPVIEEIHKEYSGKKDIVYDKIEDEAYEDYNKIQEDGEIYNLLTDVLEDYGDKTASGLSKITHQSNSPWSVTSDRKEIDFDLIRKAFESGKEM